MTSELTKSDMDTLVTMELKLRLLDLENIQIPDVPPPVPKEPSTYDFVYDFTQQHTWDWNKVLTQAENQL